MLPKSRNYQTLYKEFEWDLPLKFNIGTAISGRWAQETPDNPAILFKDAGGEVLIVSFAQLDRLANKIANMLVQAGIRRADRVAIILPQIPETAAAHIAIYKIGAVAVPMAMLFGAEGLEYRLGDSGARAVILSSQSIEKISSIGQRLPDLRTIISVDGGQGVDDLYGQIADCSDVFETVDTKPDDPALMIYTSGTTGPPKGALHGHRVLPGHLPGVQFAHEFFPRDGDMMWTPADWAWAGGLLNVLLPALYFGKPVVAHKFDKFTARQAWQLLGELPIANVFIPPTALKMMRADCAGVTKEKLSLRTIFSGGEAVGTQLQDWAQETMGLHINEVYGQTECNLVLESCGELGVLKNGAIGKPVPGAVVAIVDDQGVELATGQSGNIAVKRPHPVMFLKYWGNDQATADKYVGDWLMTGDQGFVDDEGYFHFVGRDDDVITSSGYRIGPGEIEDCLLGHPAVKLVAVVGKPDLLRTEIVVAHIVVADGFEASTELASEIQDYVKTRLAAHEYPRQVVFKSALPLTTTGKIIRRLLRNEG
jgi:acetyl-CoA synthetase